MIGVLRGLAAAAASTSSIAFAGVSQPARSQGRANNVVLVHGAFADGSGWRGVYDDLTGRG